VNAPELRIAPPLVAKLAEKMQLVALSALELTEIAPPPPAILLEKTHCWRVRLLEVRIAPPQPLVAELARKRNRLPTWSLKAENRAAGTIGHVIEKAHCRSVRAPELRIAPPDHWRHGRY